MLEVKYIKYRIHSLLHCSEVFFKWGPAWSAAKTFFCNPSRIPYILQIDKHLVATSKHQRILTATSKETWHYFRHTINHLICYWHHLINSTTLRTHYILTKLWYNSFDERVEWRKSFFVHWLAAHVHLTTRFYLVMVNVDRICTVLPL